MGHQTPSNYLPGPSQTPQYHAGGPRLPGETVLLPRPELADKRMDHIPPTEGIPAQICVRLFQARPRREQRLCTHEPSSDRDHGPGIGLYATRRLQPATTTPLATTEQGAQVDAYQLTAPCRLPCPDDRNTIIFADASGITNLTPAAGGAVLKLQTDTAGQLRQHHPTGDTIFGASSRKELTTLAIIVDAINDTHQQLRDHTHHVWLLVDAAVDLQIIRKQARQPLHKATHFSLGTQTLHL